MVGVIEATLITEFIKNNSGWIKDLSTIFFTATGTIIAILSYRRAKSTIFQPKRAEVTRIQINAMIEFLSEFTNDGRTIDNAVDYPKLLQYNIDLALRDYDLATGLEPISKRYEDLNQEIVGWYSNVGDIYKVDFVNGNLADYDKIYFNEATVKDNIEKLKKGEISLDRIFVTKKHLHFVLKLWNLSSNPFLNKEIQDVANLISKNLTINIQEKLKMVLEKQIFEIYKNREDTRSLNFEKITMKLKYSTIWVLFNIQRIKHEEDYELLIQKIRKDLMIDKKW